MRLLFFYANFAFAFVLFCPCNGMPPKQPPTPTNRRYFTDQEHELLLNMLNNFAQKGSYNPRIWKEIEKAFEEKRGKVNGFSAPRSTTSLQRHFFHIVKKGKITIPESVRELYEQMKRTCMTPQEQDFINQQLLESDDDGLSLCGDKRWINIQKRHEAKRKAGEFGFANRRSFGVLRFHFQSVMIPKNLVLEAVKRKFAVYFKRIEGVTSNGVTNEADTSSNEYVVSCIRAPSPMFIHGDFKIPYYTNQEHELMVKILESQAKTGEYKPSVWKDIEKAFEEKRKAHADGFVLHRPLTSIQQHFIRTGRIQRSDPLWKVYGQMKRISVTQEERDLINRELSRSDLPPYSLSTNYRWEKILEKHDANREAGIPGFSNKRSWRTLRNHFHSVMKPKNLVDQAVREKFPSDFENSQSASSAEEGEPFDIDSGVVLDSSMDFDSNEDYSTWIDEYGVDDFMLMDPNKDN